MCSQNSGNGVTKNFKNKYIMLLLILLIVLTVVLFIAAALFDKNYKEAGTGICCFFGALSAFALLVVAGISIGAGSDARDFIEKKNYHDEMLSIVVASDSVSTDTIKRTIKYVENDNKTILNHREYYESVFVGTMYRREVAELELTQVPDLQIKKD